MKTVKQLTRRQIEKTLENIQMYAYADFDGSHGYWDPNKELGSDFIGGVLWALDQVGLAPKKSTRF